MFSDFHSSFCLRGKGLHDFSHAAAAVGCKAKQPHREDRGRASFQSHSKATSCLHLTGFNVQSASLAAQQPSEIRKHFSKLGSFKLFICSYFSSFAIDLQVPFPRAPLWCLPLWQGSWLFSSCTSAFSHFQAAQRPAAYSVASWGLAFLCHQNCLTWAGLIPLASHLHS